MSSGSDVMSGLARDFCAYLVRASGLQCKLEAFKEQNCCQMKDGHLLLEQKLEWTLLHKAYLELMEREMDDFLREREATPEQVATALREALGKSLWSLPLLKSLDYQGFASEMFARAKLPQLRLEAMNSGGLLGGVWKLESSENLERFLKAQDVPWILRRLHIFAEIREICVVEMPGTVPIFTLTQLRDRFGVLEQQVICDGELRTEGGVQVRAWLEDQVLHIVTSHLEVCYWVKHDVLHVQSKASEVSKDTFIEDEGAWRLTRRFRRASGYEKAQAFTPCAPTGPKTRPPVARRHFRAPE